MSLQEQITADLTAAMKARDRMRTGTLRMLLAAVKNAAVAEGLGPQGALDDDTVIKLVQTEAKRRKEAATAFRDGGREESAAKEEAEAEILADYLPAQLSDDELAALVAAAAEEAGATDPSGMGQVMKVLMPRVAGRADGSRVSAAVKSHLTP
jgi:hypothetical protein